MNSCILGTFFLHEIGGGGHGFCSLIYKVVENFLNFFWKIFILNYIFLSRNKKIEIFEKPNLY